MPKPLDELRDVRIQKLNKLKERGIDAYPSVVQHKDTIAGALLKNGSTVAIAGRVMSVRGHGKIFFVDLKDESEKIQIVFKTDLISSIKSMP